MPLYWLTYRQQDDVVVFIQLAHSLIAARMKASLAGMPDEYFAEGHELDDRTAAKVPQTSIGQALSHKQATALLKKLG